MAKNKAKASPEAAYRVRIGMNYPGADGEEKRVEEGDVVNDLPAESVEPLLALGAIEPADLEPAEDN